MSFTSHSSLFSGVPPVKGGTPEKRLGLGRKNAQLSQQAQVIGQSIYVDNLAVRKTKHPKKLVADLPVRRWDVAQQPLMGSSYAVVYPDLIPFRHHLFNIEVGIGKGGVEGGEKLLLASKGWFKPQFRNERKVTLGVNALPNCLHILLVPYLDEATHESFVLFGRHQ